MDSALSYINDGGDIFERATRGRAIGNILHAVVGPNNQGQVAGQGADAFNTSLAGLANTDTMAGAQMYGYDQSLAARQAEVAEQHYQASTGTVQTGSTIGVTLFGPSPDSIIPPISKAEFVEVIKTHILAWRIYMQDVKSRPSQAYTILTMCRGLYTTRNGEQVSKVRGYLGKK